VAAEIRQVGTQFDGLGHIGIQMGADGDKKEMRYYNGHTEDEIGKPYGLAKLGVEKLKPIVTRAHLVDVAGLKGRMLDRGEEIKVQDVRDALQKQSMSEDDIRAGDAILFHTGWGSLWMQSNDRFNSGEPGLGMEVAEWVVEKDLCLYGADTWAVEVVPNPDPDLAFVVHGHLQTKHGIVSHENLTFDELLADRKYRFVYMFTPVPLQGATGSCGCPIAIT
jgi:kynurenine formamidase